jgi:hypothetical protein
MFRKLAFVFVMLALVFASFVPFSVAKAEETEADDITEYMDGPNWVKEVGHTHYIGGIAQWRHTGKFTFTWNAYNQVKCYAVSGTWVKYTGNWVKTSSNKYCNTVFKGYQAAQHAVALKHNGVAWGQSTLECQASGSVPNKANCKWKH